MSTRNNTRWLSLQLARSVHQRLSSEWCKGSFGTNSSVGVLWGTMLRFRPCTFLSFLRYSDGRCNERVLSVSTPQYVVLSSTVFWLPTKKLRYDTVVGHSTSFASRNTSRFQSENLRRWECLFGTRIILLQWPIKAIQNTIGETTLCLARTSRMRALVLFSA